MKIKFRDIMPPLSPEEFKQLEANILADGIRDPLVMWGDVLVDGHNRYEIAQKHGLKFKTVQMEFGSEAEAKIWIIVNQLGRRNIPSTATRAMLALELEPLYAEQARERMLAGKAAQYPAPPEGVGSKGETRDQLAKIARVSKASIDYAKYIKKHAPQEILDRMDAGEINLRTAYRETCAVIPPKRGRPVQPELVKPATTATEKTCAVCGRTLPAEKFYFSNGKLSSGCMQCERMKKREGISPTIREDIETIQAASDSLTDLNRAMEYTIADVIETIESEFNRLLRVTDTEVRNHPDLMKDPANRSALVKALEHGAAQIHEKIEDLVR